MPYDNPSLQVTADHQIKLVQAPIGNPGYDDVLLHVKCTGICGSDIHFWKTGAIGTLRVEGDCVLGHEASGIILKVGDGVEGFIPGDRVAIEPGVPCENCWLCREGRYNLCEEVKFSGVWPHHGTLQRFKTHPAKWLHKIPDSVSFAEAALLEPLSVVLHGIRRAGLTLGRGAVICGAGPIGLIALLAARASGAFPLVITDLEPSRLTFAKKLVPECQTYQAQRNSSAETEAENIRSLYGDSEYECPETVLECTGAESSIITAAFAVRRGGMVLVIGLGRPIVNNIPFMHLSLAEIDIKFINRYTDTWPAGIAAVKGGLIDMKSLVSHVFPLDGAVDAMHICADLSQGSIKVQIVDDIDINPDDLK